MACRVCAVGGGEYRLPCCPNPFYVYFTVKVQKCGVVRSTTGSHRNYSIAATKLTTVTAPRCSLTQREFCVIFANYNPQDHSQ